MPAPPVSLNPAPFPPGTVISVWVFPFFRHKGIVSERWQGDRPMVISNSARAGGVAEEPWEVFAAGQTVIAEGYPSTLPPAEVLRRARSLIGTKYQLLNWNCEHLTSYAHGAEPASRQVALMTVALLFGLIAVASAE